MRMCSETGTLTDLFRSNVAHKDKEIARLNSFVHELSTSVEQTSLVSAL